MQLFLATAAEARRSVNKSNTAVEYISLYNYNRQTPLQSGT